MPIDSYDFHTLLCSLVRILSPATINYGKTDNKDFYIEVRTSALSGKIYVDKEKSVHQLVKDLRRIHVDRMKLVDKETAESFVSFLSECTPMFNKMVDNYRYKSINLPTFFNHKRFSEGFAVPGEGHQVQGMQRHNMALAESLYIARDYTMSLPKEEFKHLWSVFVEVTTAFFKSVSEPVKDIVLLERLELPKDTEALRALVTSCEDLGELFFWNKTPQGFLWWARIFLDRDQYYQMEVYNFLNDLDSGLRLRIEKPKEKEKGYFMPAEKLAFGNQRVNIRTEGPPQARQYGNYYGRGQPQREQAGIDPRAYEVRAAPIYAGIIEQQVAERVRGFDPREYVINDGAERARPIEPDWNIREAAQALVGVLDNGVPNPQPEPPEEVVF